jgi:DNA-binding GntR family transcriptional regulator
MAKKDDLAALANSVGGARAAEAYLHIKSLLVGGTFRPGQRISVIELTERLQTSRQPIMAAMRHLASEGLVEIIPQVGCCVAQPDREEVRDFYRYLAQCEGLMAEFAAKRATPGEIAELDRLVEEMDAVIRKRARPAEADTDYLVLNRRFHTAVHEMAHSPVLARQIAQVFDRRDFYNNAMGGRADFEGRLTNAQHFHRLICDALQRRDGSLARQTMESHVLESPLYRTDQRS